MTKNEINVMLASEVTFGDSMHNNYQIKHSVQICIYTPELSLLTVVYTGCIVSFRIKSTTSLYLFAVPKVLSRSTTAALISDQT